MIRTALACTAALLVGYFVMTRAFRPVLASGPPAAGATVLDQDPAPSRATRRPARPASAAPAPSPTPVGPNLPPGPVCKGDLGKIPDEAVARMPFQGGRAGLEQFAKQYPTFIENARALTRQLLRDDKTAAQSCFRDASPSGSVPVVVEWHMKSAAGQLALGGGSILLMRGDPKLEPLARRCLAPLLAKSFSGSLPAPPAGEPTPDYDGAIPWPVLLTP